MFLTGIGIFCCLLSSLQAMQNNNWHIPTTTNNSSASSSSSTSLALTKTKMPTEFAKVQTFQPAPFVQQTKLISSAWQLMTQQPSFSAPRANSLPQVASSSSQSVAQHNPSKFRAENGMQKLADWDNYAAAQEQQLSNDYWRVRLDPQLFERLQSNECQIEKSLSQVAESFKLITNQDEKQWAAHAIDFMKLTIPEKFLNKSLKAVQLRIAGIIFDKNGQPCKLRPKDIRKIESEIKKFANDVKAWRMTNAKTLIEDVLNNQTYGQTNEQKKLVANLSSKQFNKDIKTIIEYCKQDQFEQAAKLVESYRLNRVSVKKNNISYELVKKTYDDYFSQRYDSSGIDRQFALSLPQQSGELPSSKYSIVVPNRVQNELLARQRKEAEQFLKQHGIRDNEINKHIAITFKKIETEYGKDAAVTYLSECLSADNLDRHLQEAYRDWFDKNGLARPYSTDLNKTTVAMPRTIHESNHARERQLLYEFSQLKIDNEVAFKAYNQGINHLARACENGESTGAHRSLAESFLKIAQGGKQNALLLDCSHLTAQLPEEHRQAGSKVLLFAAECADRLTNQERGLFSLGAAEDKLFLTRIDSVFADLANKQNQQLLHDLAKLVNTQSTFAKKLEVKVQRNLPSLIDWKNLAVKAAEKQRMQPAQELPGTHLGKVFDQAMEKVKDHGSTSPFLASMDLVTTAREQQDINLDAAALGEMFNDEQLNQEVAQILSLHLESKSLLESYNEAVVDMIHMIEQRQEDACNNNSGLVKYGKLGSLEIAKKTLELGYDLAHPVETLARMIIGSAKLLASAVKVLTYDYDSYELLINPEKIATDFKTEIDSIKSLLELPPEEKFKLGTGILFDAAVLPKIAKSCQGLKNTLTRTQAELRAMAQSKAIAHQPKKVANVKALEKAVEKELKVIEQIEKKQANVLKAEISEKLKPQKTFVTSLTQEEKFQKAFEHATTETKLKHFFDKPEHGFDDLLDSLGGKTSAEVQKLAVHQVLKELGNYSDMLPPKGTFGNLPIKFYGKTLTVRVYMAEDGVIKLSTIFYPGFIKK